MRPIMGEYWLNCIRLFDDTFHDFIVIPIPRYLPAETPLLRHIPN